MKLLSLHVLNEITLKIRIGLIKVTILKTIRHILLEIEIVRSHKVKLVLLRVLLVVIGHELSELVNVLNPLLLFTESIVTIKGVLG